MPSRLQIYGSFVSFFYTRSAIECRSPPQGMRAVSFFLAAQSKRSRLLVPSAEGWLTHNQRSLRSKKRIRLVVEVGPAVRWGVLYTLPYSCRGNNLPVIAKSKLFLKVGWRAHLTGHNKMQATHKQQGWYRLIYLVDLFRKTCALASHV